MAHAPTLTLSARHDHVRRAMRRRSVDVLVVTALPNITYLTNFSGSSAIVVMTADRLLFITDFRYVSSIKSTQTMPHACPSLELITVAGSYDLALVDTLTALNAPQVGIEGAHLTVSRYHWLQATLGARSSAMQLVPTEDVVEAARVVKDAYEIEVLREAGRRLDAVAERIVGDVKTGQTERELASLIDLRLREGGFDRAAFDTIVAAGENGALPHARPSERKLSEGDLVVLDFGGVYDSYCVDLTRTVAVGRASSRARQVHAAVLRAHDRAIAAVGPGQSRFAIDAAARDRLAEDGMADAFGHGTGHGLGIEVHEDPRIVRKRADTEGRHEFVAPGMVFTIEPGAYFPGWGGVRIEDDVLVTETGVELLTHVTTELLEL